MPRSFAQPAALAGKPTEPGAALPHIAFVLALPQGHMRQPSDVQKTLLPVCYHITERTESVSPNAALLDLGVCREDEPHTILCGLQQRLAKQGYVVSVGVGASCILAQLALLSADAQLKKRGIIRTLLPTDVSAIPTHLLPLLHPCGAISSEVIERLQRYGLRTLGHIARLTESQLRRQFGDTMGDALLTLAQGHDLRPLSPTQPPCHVTVRVRLPTPLAPAQLLALTPTIGARIAAQLQQGRCAHGLSMQVRWAHGARTSIRVTLRQPTAEGSQLSAALRSLLTQLLSREQHDAEGVEDATAVDDLWITLEAVTPLYPAQLALWPTHEARLRRQTTLQTIATTLAQRHHRPLLTQAQLTIPDAIFAEDRYALRELDMPTAATSARTATSHKRIAAHMTDADTVWRDVPQRLHWW